MVSAPSFEFDTINNNIVNKQSYCTLLNQIFLWKFLLTLKQTKAGCPVVPWYQKYVKNASFQGIPLGQSLSIEKITTPSSGGCKFAFVYNTGWF